MMQKFPTFLIIRLAWIYYKASIPRDPFQSNYDSNHSSTYLMLTKSNIYFQNIFTRLVHYINSPNFSFSTSSLGNKHSLTDTTTFPQQRLKSNATKFYTKYSNPKFTFTFTLALPNCTRRDFSSSLVVPSLHMNPGNPKQWSPCMCDIKILDTFPGENLPPVRITWCCVPSPQSNSHHILPILNAVAETFRDLEGIILDVPRKRSSASGGSCKLIFLWSFSGLVLEVYR